MLHIFGQLIESFLHLVCRILTALFEGGQYSCENTPCPSSVFGYRPKANLAGHNRRSEISFGQVVFCRDSSIPSPMVQPAFVFSENVLNPPNPQMARRPFHCGLDLGAKLGCSTIELLICDRLAAKPLSERKQGSHNSYK